MRRRGDGNGKSLRVGKRGPNTSSEKGGWKGKVSRGGWVEVRTRRG